MLFDNGENGLIRPARPQPLHRCDAQQACASSATAPHHRPALAHGLPQSLHTNPIV
jgi:hypothetical protein